MALTNLWGSYFSRAEQVGGKPTAMAKPFRRGIFNKVGLNVGEPVAGGEMPLDQLRVRVATLLEAGSGGKGSA